MVYTYTGITRVLWGSLPSEQILADDRRSIQSNRLSFSFGGDDSRTSSLINPNKSAYLIVQENRQKAAKMLIAVVIIFAICYIPVHAFNLFR